MRKTAKARDDVPVPDGVVDAIFNADRRKQGNRALLIGKEIAVFERQVRKRSP